jgi:hypothetical protein
MGVFVRLEAQRPGERIDGGDRRADRPPLFQPHVPVDPDAGELGYFFAPQARRPSPARVRQPHIRGAEPRPPGPEKITKFSAARVRHGVSFACGRDRLIPG